ncbi:MAG: SDR family oxidoreductase [bacterium]|nr:SDR family oxidoreductase [bacterium]
MDLGLTGRTALVTGGSRGFGRAVALRLAAEGAHVALLARGADALSVAAEEVAREGARLHGANAARVLPLVADVTDDVAVRRAVARVEAELGPPDLLLVNAGGPPAGNFGDLDLAAWESAYRLTVESAVRLCRLVVPGMVERRWGRVVCITSVSVYQPVENLMLSSVLRPAVQALTRTLALETAAAGVTVNAVAPGFHLTSAVERLITRKQEQTGAGREEVIRGWTREIPLGRLGEADELAALVAFLMSAPAGYITGQCVVSDGGWVRGTF